MKDKAVLSAIVHYIESGTPGAHGTGYYFLELFDRAGVVSMQEILPIFEAQNGALASGQMVGPFEGLSGVREFALKVNERMALDEFRFLTLDKFNQLVEKAHSVHEFNEALEQEVEVVENPEKKNSGILGKIFN
jgi:hypothetical protein